MRAPPDSGYGRRAFDPRTDELIHQFVRVCKSKGLLKITALVDIGPPDSYPENLSGGFSRAISEKHVEVSESPLDKGAVINRGAPAGVAYEKSPAIF